MKKVLSILLAVCLTVAAIPVFSVSAKAENILKNGDFSDYSESALSNATAAALNNQTWIHNTGTPCTIASAPVDSENHGYGIVLNNYLIQSMPTLKSNTTYTLSFDYMRAASAPDSGINLRILIIERATPQNVYMKNIVDDGATSGYGNYKYFDCSATAWKTKQYTFTTGELENKIYSICFIGVGKTTNGIMQLDNISVKEVVEPTNSGLIMDGDFEATEQLPEYTVSNMAITSALEENKWYKSPTGTTTLVSNEEQGNYITLQNRGRITQKLKNVQLNDSVIITFKAKEENRASNSYGTFFYVAPISMGENYWYRGQITLTSEWQEYTLIYNPEGESNFQTAFPSAEKDSNDHSGEDFIFSVVNFNAATLVSIDDIRVEKADPFASNDLGQAELTGVSMRGANGTLPTAIRWKNAITKTFAENGVGDFNEVIEYGALVANTSTLGANNEKLTENATSAKIKGVAYNATTSKLFAETEEYNIFSLALSGITTENYGKALTVRPYVKISNGQKIITVYGESRSNSLFDACHAVLSGTNETDIALVKGILTETDAVKQAYLEVYSGDSEKLQ